MSYLKPFIYLQGVSKLILNTFGDVYLKKVYLKMTPAQKPDLVLGLWIKLFNTWTPRTEQSGSKFCPY